MMKFCPYLLVAFMAMPMLSQAQTDYSALNYWKFYSDAENTLYKQQCDISFELLKKRKAKIAQLSSLKDWKNRQEYVKEMLNKVVGPFPDKTPLNPVTTGNIKGDGFTVEKLYFESMPGYMVTAAFFLPEGKRQKLPTIIYCSGHSDLAFRSDTYQHVIINLVKKGFAVFAFDPIGQGERQQYFNQERGKSRFGPTQEHSYPGAQLFIQGASVARYMIWDGIRSVDYLLTRKEVDPERIGITGRSGGGTQSSYIAAFDDRIKAAAPECYITSYEYLLKSRGPQDAEQNFMHALASGFDEADLLEVRAPKPALMITTTRDIFSIEGARATYGEVKKAYSAFDKADYMAMVEDDAGHASTLKNREAMYAFFQKHLDNPGPGMDVAIDTFQVEELYVTETGQLSTSIGSKFLYDINLELAHSNSKKRDAMRSDASYVDEVKATAKEISGYNKLNKYGKLVFSGKTEFKEFFLEKYILEGDAMMPFVVFNPRGECSKTALYLDDIKDKKSDQAHEIPLQLARDGVRVIVLDLPGYGELGPGYLRGDAYFSHTSYNQWFAGILNKKSMVAIHAEAIESLLFHSRELYGNQELMGISKGPFNSTLLHAGVLGIAIDEFVMIDPVMSFESLVSHRDYAPSFVPFAVAGQLEFYDLPDLASSLAPKRIKLINARDHQGEIAEISMVEAVYDFIKEYAKNMSAKRAGMNGDKCLDIFVGEDYLDEILN